MLQNTTVTAFSRDNGLSYLALFTIQDVTDLNTRIVAYRKVRDQAVNELEKRREIELRLRKEKRFISLLLDTARALIMLLDKQGRIMVFNRACEELTGYDSREVENVKNIDFFILPDEKETLECFSNNCLKSVPQEFENHWMDRDGQKRLISWSNTLVYDEEGNPEFVLSTGIDITEQRRMQHKIKHMAMHDELTGLANRNLLQESMKDHIARANRSKSRIAVLFLDLDGFKVVNDRYGHSAGDEVLKEVANRLTNLIRASDTVARFGGDEFVVVLPEIRSHKDAVKVCKKISSALAVPFSTDKDQFKIGVSIGISIYPDDGPDIETVMRLADKAMYVSKGMGRNRCCYLGYDCE